MPKIVVSLQQISKQYHEAAFNALFGYAQANPHVKKESNYLIVPHDETTRTTLSMHGLFCPDTNYLMLIDREKEAKED